MALKKNYNLSIQAVEAYESFEGIDFLGADKSLDFELFQIQVICGLRERI